MAKSVHLYSCLDRGVAAHLKGVHLYQMFKLAASDLETLATYNIQESASGTLHCDCPAHKPWCRHCDMLRKFQAEERIGKGWMYDYDKKSWIPPYTPET
jgi:hypothetical protein